MFVDTPEIYKRASLVHVEHDAQISEFAAEGIEKDISAHSEAWSRILGIGSNWNQTDRVRKNMISKDSALEPLFTLRADHKVCQDVLEGPPLC